eukprot:TRINITY_DN1883_c0_g4_i1.p1 TRINITY_DN1883_c0_g4~~TRINITY_DN1883_c0_g4_i1.p1  ORF type:complete len:545 (-),score=224.42 TRINITY_DN1883_c0_g4_i1:131-1765(-)
MAANHKVFVVGVGMTKFEKPNSSKDYPETTKEAITKALADSSIHFSQIQQICVGYVYGDSTCGQRAVYEVGMTGVPIYNVNNNCSTGSSALLLAKQLIQGAISDCILVLGFEKMQKGSLKSSNDDRANPIEKHMVTMMNLRGIESGPPAPQLFGNAGREHMEKYGTTQQHFAKIAYKNHKHSVDNPYSQFQIEYSLDEILNSPSIHFPLTKLQCCPTSDGAAAVILCSQQFIDRHPHLKSSAVEILAMTMATDQQNSFTDSCINVVGYDMSRRAALNAYQQASIGPNDIQVIELHDCFSCNELITYEALGLCKQGEASKIIDNNDNTHGGKWLINPSGGLISKGHPLGATGLAQCCELSWQLRGMCGKRQHPNVRFTLQHNIGLGGAAIVAIYQLAYPNFCPKFSNNELTPAIDPTFIPTHKTQPQTIQTLTNSTTIQHFVACANLHPNFVDQIKSIFQFDLITDDGNIDVWSASLKCVPIAVYHGSADSLAQIHLKLKSTDFHHLVFGNITIQQLLLSNSLSIQGDLNTVYKLEMLFQTRASL